MADLGLVGIAISIGVGGLQLLSYLNTRSTRKEISLDKFAKADGVALEITNIKSHLLRIDEKLDDYSSKISTIQIQNGICENQHEHAAEDMRQQLNALEKLIEKIEELK